MTAEIVTFPDRPETEAVVQRGAPAIIIVLPVIRIERLPEPKTRRYPRKKPRP